MFPDTSFLPMLRQGRGIHGGVTADRPGPGHPGREGPFQSQRPGGPSGVGPARPGRRGGTGPRGPAGRAGTVARVTAAPSRTGTPPLRACWSAVGEQAEVPITGNRGKTVLYGALKPASGVLGLDGAGTWNQHTFQDHLRTVRAVW